LIKNRLYSLEVLRFIAAFTIMYGHFVVHYLFNDINTDKGFFPNYLNPFASLAVPFFFMMSGAIFAMNYGNIISKGEITLHNYILKRVARLYPLHFLTLIIAAITQHYILNISGKYYYIENNDFYHFILNLFFASDWGLQTGNSFNSPVWSVSHEFLIYFVFYKVCRSKFLANRPIWQKYLFFLFVIFIIRHAEHGGGINLLIIKIPIYDLILQSMFTFFGGALLYEFSYYFNNLSKKKYIKFLFFLITLIFLTLISDLIKKEGVPFGSLGYILLFLFLLLDFNYKDGFSKVYEKTAMLLGGISYSIYLIHMPVIFLMGLLQIKYQLFDFLGYVSLSLFLILSLILGYLSFLFFEKPMQKYIIKTFKNKNK